MAMARQARGGGHSRSSRRQESHAVLLLLSLILSSPLVCHAFLPTTPTPTTWKKASSHVPPLSLSSWSGGSSYLDTIQKTDPEGSGTVANHDDENENNFSHATKSANGYNTAARIQEKQPQQQQQQPVPFHYYDEIQQGSGGDLPKGWTAHLDPQSGRYYYFSAADGTSTWERPAAIQQPTTHQQEESQHYLLPDGWTSHLDPESNCYYYYFAADGTSTWERPPPAMIKVAPALQQQQASSTTTRVVESPIPKTQQQQTHPEIMSPLVLTQKQEARDDSQKNAVEEEDRYLKLVSSEIGVKKLNGQNPYSVLDIRYDVVLSQQLDALEDALMKMRRKMAEDRDYDMDKQGNHRPTVIVLGTGWAAQSFVKIASTFDLRILVVSPVNHFVRSRKQFAKNKCILNGLLGPFIVSFLLRLVPYGLTFIVIVSTGIYSHVGLGRRWYHRISQHDGTHSCFQSYH
jgi:WW domain